MAFQYTGSILDVDLTRRTTKSVAVDAATLRKYVGGSGLAAKIVWDETGAGTDPLSPENPLVFMTGPLTGTPAPQSSRYVAAAISPLTGIWGEAYGGGTWPYNLRRTPYLGIIVRGKADAPVSLVIDNADARIVDAGHLWGKDTFEVHDILSRAAGRPVSALTIGPAGEKLVNLAGIMSDGTAARAAARCGLGAVMGSKNLKAIVAGGSGRLPVYDREGLRASVNRHLPTVEFSPEKFYEKNKQIWLTHVESRGCVKNFTLGQFQGFGEKLLDLSLKAKPWFCPGCRTSCLLSMTVDGQRHPPGEHMLVSGANCLIDDMETLVKALELCNRYGLDCISTGQVIAVAMELYEKGLLSRRDTGGIELTWGNHRAMTETVVKIGNREGVGELLGQGVRAVCQQIGGLALEYAIHVKGLEFPLYDPRTTNSMALQYATSSRGAHHMEGRTGAYDHRFKQTAGSASLPGLEDGEALAAAGDPFAVKGMGRLTAWTQDYGNLLDCLGMCKFVTSRFVWVREPAGDFTNIGAGQLLEWLNLVTGWDVSMNEFMKAGERVFNLKRLINVSRGISRKDDTLPPRFLTRKRGGKGPAADYLPPLGTMLSEYYACRGWTEEGVPSAGKLAELGL